MPVPAVVIWESLPSNCVCLKNDQVTLNVQKEVLHYVHILKCLVHHPIMHA